MGVERCMNKEEREPAPCQLFGCCVEACSCVVSADVWPQIRKVNIIKGERRGGGGGKGRWGESKRNDGTEQQKF